MPQTVPLTIVLGASKTGLAIGYRVLNLDRTVYSAFTTTGVSESAVAGTYYASSGIAAPDTGGYVVCGTVSTDYAETTVSPSVSAVRRATALANLKFLMTLDRAPVTGATVTATISKDAGAFAGTANSVTEIGNGIYSISLTAAEMTAQVVTLRFIAAGCDDLLITLPVGY